MQTAKADDKYSGLFDYFGQQLPWHKARIKFFVLLLTALCKVQTVCFERLAEGMDSPAQISSSLRRIQRFFADFTIDKEVIARLLFSLLPCKTNLTISIDRTNWQFTFGATTWWQNRHQHFHAERLLRWYCLSGVVENAG